MGLLIYLAILFSKIIEVSLSTLRIVFITKGERVIGSIIAFFEISIWLVLASTVLSSLQQDPFKALMYALGFVIGNYIGSWLEEKIGLGIVTLNIVCKEKDEEIILEVLQSLKIGYTLLESQGQVEDNRLIIANIMRRRKTEVIKALEGLDIKFFVSISESRAVYGGYGLKK